MVLAGPLQGTIMGKLFGLNRHLVKYTDGRVKTTNEALQGIQSVKFFAWEVNFEKMINVDRHKELGFLGQVSYLRGFSRAYITALPGLVAVASFVTFALGKIGADVSASTLFAALLAFDQLRFPLLFYPMALAQIAQASVSAARVQQFLLMKEVGSGEQIGTGTYDRDAEASPGDIQVKSLTVYWKDPQIPLDETQHSIKSTHSADSKSNLTEADTEIGDIKYAKPVLKDVSVHVKPGELCSVVGRVGSGKSTLCSAILNETLQESGEITLRGKVAYASQSPWILNATLRDNILFGLPMDVARYAKVLEVCQLSHDLAMLDNGDMTEIGEKGKCISPSYLGFTESDSRSLYDI
jgi:ABC-type multidrug transport system fused ATPase/permease subunit